MKRKFSIGGFFAGIGGIDLAFKQAGFNIKWANEIDEKACKIYGINVSPNIICNSISNIHHKNLNEVDVITAGFPCQAFSKAGAGRGFEDPRGAVFFDLIKAIKSLRPRILFLENVKNLLFHDKSKTFKKMISMLESIDYKIIHNVINSCEYSDIPQNRERLYIICFLKQSDYDSFEPIHEVKKNKKIIDFLEKDVNLKYYYYNTKLYDKIKDLVTKKYFFYQYRRNYLRKMKSNLCPTLSAAMGMGGHNVPIFMDDKGIRRLTPRECFRFQGFKNDFFVPEDISDSMIYKFIGNSVSIPVVKSIAQKILKVLSSK